VPCVWAGLYRSLSVSRYSFCDIRIVRQRQAGDVRLGPVISLCKGCEPERFCPIRITDFQEIIEVLDQAVAADLLQPVETC
jgi:hypothetical protein